MSKTAVIKTGGKQYVVEPGSKIKIEKIKGKENDSVKFDQVLLVSEEKEVKIGEPVVKGAVVEGKILEQTRDKKISVVKYKPKTRYKRNVGHRQHYTRVEITKI